jgi:hypothetical protein
VRKTVGFSHGDFGLVIQPLYDTAGNQFLGAEVVQDELAMLPQGAGGPRRFQDAGKTKLGGPLPFPVTPLPNPLEVRNAKR